MSTSARLKKQLLAIKQKRNDSLGESQFEQKCTPLESLKHSVHHELEKSAIYRKGILRKLKTFADMDEDLLEAVVDGMEDFHVGKGYVIVRQGDRGDAFYVLMDGIVSVTRMKKFRSRTEKPKEIIRLGKDAVFGEVSLYTEEPRTATVTVVSDSAHVIKITRESFKDIMGSANSISKEVRLQIAKASLLQHRIFFSLTPSEKDNLLESMTQVKYNKGSVICKQGNMAHSFYIICEGVCGISLEKTKNLENEKDLSPSGKGTRKLLASSVGESSDLEDENHLQTKLYPGDVFGESCMKWRNDEARYGATVYAADVTYCMVLDRKLMLSLVTKKMKANIAAHQNRFEQSKHRSAHKSVGGVVMSEHDMRRTYLINSKNRRISVYDFSNKVHSHRISNLLRRFSKYTSESLYLSLYSRLYREVLLDSDRMHYYGEHVIRIMTEEDPFGFGVSSPKNIVTGTMVDGVSVQTDFTVAHIENDSGKIQKKAISTDKGASPALRANRIQSHSPTTTKFGFDELPTPCDSTEVSNVPSPREGAEEKPKSPFVSGEADFSTPLSYSPSCIQETPKNKNKVEFTSPAAGTLLSPGELPFSPGGTEIKGVVPHYAEDGGVIGDISRKTSLSGIATSFKSTIQVDRSVAIEAFQKLAMQILSVDPAERSENDHLFVYALMSQRNQVRDKLCNFQGYKTNYVEPPSLATCGVQNVYMSDVLLMAKGGSVLYEKAVGSKEDTNERYESTSWSWRQYLELCRKLSCKMFSSMETIFEYGSHGSCAYLIARGSVRIFTEAVDPTTGRKHFVYDQDICAGELIGEVVLEGVQFRCNTAIAVTEVELIVIEKHDFESAFKFHVLGDSKGSEVSIDSRMQFLSKCPLLSPLSTSELLVIARLMKHKSYQSDSLLMSRNCRSRHLCFVMEGEVDISQTRAQAPKPLTKWQKAEESDKFVPEHGKFVKISPNVILSLLKYSYYGESGLLTCWQQSLVNPNLKKRRDNEFDNAMEAAIMVEKNDAFSHTPVEVLLLSEENFYLLPNVVLQRLKDECEVKVGWRDSRKREFRAGRKSITGLQSNINNTVNRILVENHTEDLELMQDTYYLEKALDCSLSASTASDGSVIESGAVGSGNLNECSHTTQSKVVFGQLSKNSPRRQSGTLPVLLPKSRPHSIAASHVSLAGDGLNESIFDDGTIRSGELHSSVVRDISQKALFGSTKNAILFSPPKSEGVEASQSLKGYHQIRARNDSGEDAELEDDATLGSDSFTDTVTETVVDTATESATAITIESVLEENRESIVGGTGGSESAVVTNVAENVLQEPGDADEIANVSGNFPVIRSNLIPSVISRISVQAPSYGFDDCHIGKNNYAGGIALEVEMDKISGGYNKESNDACYRPNSSIQSFHSVLSVLSKTSLGDLSATSTTSRTPDVEAMQSIPHNLLSMYDPLLLNATCKTELEKRHLKQIRSTAVKRAQIPVNKSFMKQYKRQVQGSNPKKNPTETMGNHISFPIVRSPSVSPVVPFNIETNLDEVFGGPDRTGVVGKSSALSPVISASIDNKKYFEKCRPPACAPTEPFSPHVEFSDELPSISQDAATTQQVFGTQRALTSSSVRMKTGIDNAVGVDSRRLNNQLVRAVGHTKRPNTTGSKRK